LCYPSSENVSPRSFPKTRVRESPRRGARPRRATTGSYVEVRENATGRLITAPSIRSPMLYPTELQARQAVTIHQRRANLRRASYGLVLGLRSTPAAAKCWGGGWAPSADRPVRRLICFLASAKLLLTNVGTPTRRDQWKRRLRLILKARTMRHGPGLRASVLDYAEPGCCCAVTSGHGHGDRESGESRAAAQTVAQCIRRGAR
jgi:hypothetical protein